MNGCGDGSEIEVGASADEDKLRKQQVHNSVGDPIKSDFNGTNRLKQRKKAKKVSRHEEASHLTALPVYCKQKHVPN